MNKLSISGSINYYCHPYENKCFFDELKFECKGGEISSILGISGVGKSTLLKIILGEAEGVVDSDIKYFFNDQSNCPNDAKLKGWIGFLSTEPSLIPWKNIKENLLIPSLLNKNLKMPIEYDILEIISKVGLEKKVLTLKPHEASFGMKQRISLARVLLYNPKYLLLDELFTGIDEVTSDFISDLLSEYVIRRSTPCVLVTHDVRKAILISKNIYILTSQRKLISLDCKVDEIKIRNYLLEDIKENLSLNKKNNSKKEK